MASDSDRSASALGPAASNRLAALRAAESLADLVSLTGASAENEAYREAKREWRDLRGRELALDVAGDGLPGTQVEVDGRTVWIHGLTHAATASERTLLHDTVAQFRDAGHAIYCEQGIRSMYFQDWDGVCEMDDYQWAMARCRELDVDSHVDSQFDEPVTADLRSVASEFQDAVFSLIESGSDIYGRQFQRALGDVATDFLRSHADMATGDEFESFRLHRLAAENPARLRDLQHYYERTFLPQPVEREWLRQHDRKLELVTHARNERMADYVMYHVDSASEVHLLVGAAHQPGIRYYLEQYRAGDRTLASFEPLG